MITELKNPLTEDYKNLKKLLLELKKILKVNMAGF